MRRSISKMSVMVGCCIYLMVGGVGAAYNYPWCANKLANLEKQMGYAKQYNNYGRIQGLERAIANVRHKCGVTTPSNTAPDYDLGEESAGIDHSATDSFEAEAWQREFALRDRILDQKRKVLDAEYEVEKAKLYGNEQKVAEKRLKLKKRQAELELYEAELSEYAQ